jgi:uncharacterized membrane protein YgdD (TMEM256/DUF423 family)
VKPLLIIGSLCGALAVTLGAFGAHGLKNRVDTALLQTWNTACEYHFYHALAILLVGILAKQFGGALINTAGWFLVAGSTIFSGSLYLLVLTNTRWLGAITPIGGMLLIIGWLTLAWALFKQV